MEQCGPLELDMFSDEGNHEPILVQITPTCHGREEGDDGEDLYSSSDGRWLALLEAGQQRQPLTCSTSLFHTTHNSNSSSLVAVGCFNNLILVREAGHEHEAEKYGWTMVDVAAESPFAPVPLTPCLDHTISTYSSLTVFSLHSFALLAARSSFSNKRNGKRLGKRQSLLRRHSATTRHLQRTLDSVSASSYSSSSSSLKCAQHVVKLLVDLITPLTTSSSSATTAITCQPLIPENYFEEENQLARLMLDGDYVVLDPFYLSCPPPPACIPDPDHLIHYSPFSHSLLDNMMQRIVSDHASEDRKTIKSHLHTKHLLDGILQIPHHNPDPTIPCANPLLLVNIDASSAALLMNSYIHVPLPFSIHESRRVDHHVYLNLPLKLGLQYQFNTPKTSSPSLSLSAHNRSIKLPASDSADIQFLDILSAGLEPMASSGFVKVPCKMPRLDITGGYGGSGFASLIHSCLINKSLRRSSSLISPSSLSSRVYGAFMEELENLTLAIFAQKELVFAPPPFVSDLFCDESTVTKLVQQAMQSIIIITKAIGECDFVLELDISEGTQQSPPLPQSVPQSPGLVTTAAGCKRNWQEMDDVLDNEFDDSCELEYNLTAFVDIPHEVARHDPTTSPVLLRSASTAASTTAKKPRPNLNNILSLHPRITTPPRPVTIKSSLMDFMRLRNNLKQTLPAPFRQKTITSTCPLVASTGTPLITARTTPVVNTKPMILMGNSAITRRNMVPSPRSPIRPSFATTCAIAPPPPTILSPPTLTHSHLIVCDLPFFSRDYASRRIVRLLESKFNIELVERNLSKQYDRYSSAAAAANGGGTITTASDRKGDTTTPCSPPNLFVFAPDLVLNEASCVVFYPLMMLSQIIHRPGSSSYSSVLKFNTPYFDVRLRESLSWLSKQFAELNVVFETFDRTAPDYSSTVTPSLSSSSMGKPAFSPFTPPIVAALEAFVSFTTTHLSCNVVSHFYSSSVFDSVSIIRQLAESGSLLRQKAPVSTRQRLDDPVKWFTRAEGQRERFLCTLSCMNPFSAQIIIQRVPKFGDLFHLSFEQLKALYSPWISDGILLTLHECLINIAASK